MMLRRSLLGAGGLALIALLLHSPPGPCPLAIAVALALAGMVAAAGRDRRVTAGRNHGAEGKPRAYSLSFGEESVTLDPGRPWSKVDAFKWVTRGLIEEPQSFHVLPNGTVDINSERIPLDDPDGVAKLEHEINKHHPPSVAHKPPPVLTGTLPGADSAGPAKVQFKVKVDHLGHLMIECTRGAERVETGLRGLTGLVTNGFMLKPGNLHVDPLQRYIEIDGTRFDANAEGARELQGSLNSCYAPALKTDDANVITIRENPASATGFDIDFMTAVAGARTEVKGHLTQDRLNLLLDPKKCDLVQPGILFRLSPPHLLIRRRRPDGGEEAIPGLPDLHYLRASAAQLQHLFNHPLVRRHAGPAVAATVAESAPAEAQLAALHVGRNPQNRMFLWLEAVFEPGGRKEGRAFTHHNVADLQHRGVFKEHLDVSLSLDNHRLGILDRLTGHEQAITLDGQSDDVVLSQASQLLSSALRSAAPQRTGLAPTQPAAGV